jgi:hypothetical protein
MRIDDDGQGFVVYINGGGSIGSGVATGGDDEGDLLHLEVDAIKCQDRFCIAGEGWHPGKSGGIKVFAGDDCEDTRDL